MQDKATAETFYEYAVNLMNTFKKHMRKQASSKLLFAEREHNLEAMRMGCLTSLAPI